MNLTMPQILIVRYKEIENFNNMNKTNNCFSPTGTCFIQKIYAPPLPYFKVNICHFPLPHFASIFFVYLWSFHWPNYIVTLPRYFSFRLPHLNIPTGPPSDELDKNIHRKSLRENLSHWNWYNHFLFALDFSYAFGIL
jgi:hypothetical protein